MFQTNTSNFNSTNNKYLSNSNYQDFSVIKFTKMKKDKRVNFSNLGKTNYNLNSNIGKTLNNISTYYSSSSYPDLVLTNSTNKNFLESQKNYLLSTTLKTKEDSFTGFFPKSKFLNAIKKTEIDNEKIERNEKSEKEKSSEKYHIKNLEFNGNNNNNNNNNNDNNNNNANGNLNLNTTQISTFISPSNRLNNIFYNNTSTHKVNNENQFYNNNNNSQHIPEISYSNYNNTKTNQNYQSFLHSINVTNNGFNTTFTNGSYKNNTSKFNNKNKINIGTNTNLSSNNKENNEPPNLNNEFKSVYSGVTNKFGQNLEFINYNKNKNSSTSYYNNCIISNNKFSKFDNDFNNNKNNHNEIEDLKNFNPRYTNSSSLFKSFYKFTKTQHNPNNITKNISKEKKKVVNMSDFDQFELYRENYIKMRDEQFLKDTAYSIYDKFYKKKLKKFIFKEITTNDFFKEIIHKITRLVEIKRNNNEFVSVEYIVNMLREEIDKNSIDPIHIKNEDLMLPLINKKSTHAALEFESEFNQKKLSQRFIKSETNNYLKNNRNNYYKSINNKYLASSISEEVENYWENRNGRNDDSIATNIKMNGEKYIIKTKKKRSKREKKKTIKENGESYTESTSEYYQSESNLDAEQSNSHSKKQKRRRKRLFSAEGDASVSQNYFSQNESSDIDQDLSELERKRRRRRRRKDKYANLPRTSDIAPKLLGNLEVNLEKEMKFLNTQKNFFMKRLDSFLVTQSSGFDGLSENMLRRTLNILDKYGHKKNKRNNQDKVSGEKDGLESQQTEFVKIKAKDNFENNNFNKINNNNNNINHNKNNTNENNNFDTTNANQNISSVKNPKLNFASNFNSKANGIPNIPNNNNKNSGVNAKSPKKKFNLKDLKLKKTGINEANNKTNSNNNINNTESIKNAETEGKNTLLINENSDLLNSQGKLTTENNRKMGLLDNLNGTNETEDRKTEGNKPKKTRKRIVKKLKEVCAEGAEDYEEVEIEETDPDEEVIQDFENNEAYKNSLKDTDVDTVDIGNFKKFMMESLFTPQPNNNENNNAEIGNEEKKKRRKRKTSLEDVDLISENSNEFEDDDDWEDQVEEYLETEEYLNTETGEIEVKRVKKTRRINNKNGGEEQKGKKSCKKKRDSNEAIYNPQLDMLMKMIQDEENKNLSEQPDPSIRKRRLLKNQSLLLMPIGMLIDQREIPEEEPEEVESDDTTESERNSREERLRIEREKNEIMKKKINDTYVMGINQNMNFQMSQGSSEADMNRYQDLLEKIESLKSLDPGNYMKNIRMLLDEFKREEQDIHELKKIERRINDFKYELAEDRLRVSLARETKLSSLKMRDRTFNTTVSELSKNVITQRKVSKFN